MTQISKERVLSEGKMGDVEAGGPSPARYPLLSIGAVAMDDHRDQFYAELKPDIWNFLPSAMAVNKLDPNKLLEKGLWPKDALTQFVQRQISEIDPIEPDRAGLRVPESQ